MDLLLHWPARRAPQPLQAREIHVWAWSLSGPAPHDGGVQTLDREEIARLSGLRFEADRARFAIAHTRLRSILGAYLGKRPEDLLMERNAFGKPDLAAAEDCSGPSLRFNLTHTRRCALLAVSSRIGLGIDLEDVAPIEPEVARDHFSKAELEQLRTLSGEEWLRGFYRCWTQKEAVLKAEGVGLNLELASFDVALLPAAPAGLIGVRGSLRCHWELLDLYPGPQMIGALAYDDPQAQVRRFQLQAD